MPTTWGSNGPVERTGSEACRQVHQAFHGEAPCGVRESTRATCDGVDFHNTVKTGCVRRLGLADKRSEDAVSIGCDQLTAPHTRTIREGHGNVPKQCRSTKVGSDSVGIPVDHQCSGRRSLEYVVFMSLDRTAERDLLRGLLCRRRGGAGEHPGDSSFRMTCA